MDEPPFDRDTVDATGHDGDEVYVHASGLAVMGTAGADRPNVWDGWSDEDRFRVEHLYRVGLEQFDRVPRDPGVLSTPHERPGALLQSMVTELAARGELETAPLQPGALEVKFDSHDLGWVRSGYGWLLEKLNIGEFDWIAPDDEPVEIADDARLAILGDWGSGRYGAPACAGSIASDPAGFDVVIHLGDVYYSGTSKEVRSNFLRWWPWQTTPRGEAVLFRACNSNHEMYSGGKPYVELTLREFGQRSSVFALQNAHWLFVGLDTAYDEWHLGRGQLAWLRDLLERSAPRKVVFLSHHQPFSHFMPYKEALATQLDRLIRDAGLHDRVHAWYWGHEHLGMVYEPDERWGLRGRCVGHGGFPYVRERRLRGLPQEPALDRRSDERLVRVPADTAPAALVVDGPNAYISDDPVQQAAYGPNGFMTVECDAAQLHERMVTADGLTLWESTI